MGEESRSPSCTLLALAAAVLVAWRGRPDRGAPRSALARFEPDRPALRWPWELVPSRPTSLTAVVAAAVVTTLAAVSVPDWHALAPAAGVVTVLALRHRRLWWLAPMAAALACRFRWRAAAVWAMSWSSSA